MALFFPLNITNQYNPFKKNTGHNLQHCTIDFKGIKTRPFQLSDVFCYGPQNPSPTAPSKRVRMVPGEAQFGKAGVIEPKWNDPTGNIYITLNEMLPVVLKYTSYPQYNRNSPNAVQNYNFLKAFMERLDC